MLQRGLGILFNAEAQASEAESSVLADLQPHSELSGSSIHTAFWDNDVRGNDHHLLKASTLGFCSTGPAIMCGLECRAPVSFLDRASSQGFQQLWS